jgi:hypothetical protein
MMMRACLSLLIAAVVKDLVTPQVSGTPFDCVFVLPILLQTSEKRTSSQFVWLEQVTAVCMGR